MSNDAFRPPPSRLPEPMPEDLDGMERQILADNSDWEQGVPAWEPLNQQLRRRLTEERMREPESSSSLPTWLAEQNSTGEHETPPASGGRPPSKMRTMLAVVAAVVIVGLLAAVFADLTRGRAQRGPAASATATAATPTPKATLAPRIPLHMLAPRPPLTGQPGVPVVAPSDPNVIYEYADNGNGVVLRRSDDGGTSWHDLGYPSGGAFVGAIELAVSPVDSRNVFLRLDLGYQPGGINPCQQVAETQHGGMLASGNTNCRVEVYSRDGGVHWSRITLPIAGSLFQSGVTFSYDPTTIQAGGDGLYGRVWQYDTSGSQTGDLRIVSTRDQGHSWQSADADLVRTAGHVCAFGATPLGTTIFAITSSSACWTNPAGDRSIWRSDDDGAHWMRAGDLPVALTGPDAQFIAASEGNTDGMTPILYGIPGAAATRGAAEVQVSSDGGQTWHAAPSSGLPTGAQMMGVADTALPDGSILMDVSAPTAPPHQSGATPGPTATATDPTYGGQQSSTVCYVWRSGDTSWHQVTPAAPIDGPNITNIFASNGPNLVITISVAGDQSSNPTYVLRQFH